MISNYLFDLRRTLDEAAEQTSPACANFRNLRPAFNRRSYKHKKHKIKFQLHSPEVFVTFVSIVVASV